ncbi:MAG TPA: GNAT family N-acetyltransferase [Acidimicrobiales bacterium]|nr:GNAT family N-acetyltransferase [Acidimicrobiales bacterium]
MPSPLRLRPPRPDDEAACRAAHDALAAEGFEFLLVFDPDEPWARHVARVEAHRRGADLPDGFVASTFLLAEVDGQVVGRTSIRHELNEFLLTVGGHIGYAVLPEHRRRGHATEILRQSLVLTRALGIDRALVTCDEGNVASAAVIERCGGVLESVVDNPRGGPRRRRYWID